MLANDACIIESAGYYDDNACCTMECAHPADIYIVTEHNAIMEHEEAFSPHVTVTVRPSHSVNLFRTGLNH